MYNPFIQKITTSLGIAFLALGLSAVAHAEKSDFEKKVFIKSERNGGDLKNKIISYMDNVVITQGTIKITADLVQVMGKESENNEKLDVENPIYMRKG